MQLNYKTRHYHCMYVEQKYMKADNKFLKRLKIIGYELRLHDKES